MWGAATARCSFGSWRQVGGVRVRVRVRGIGGVIGDRVRRQGMGGAGNGWGRSMLCSAHLLKTVCVRNLFFRSNCVPTKDPVTRDSGSDSAMVLCRWGRRFTPCPTLGSPFDPS